MSTLAKKRFKWLNNEKGMTLLELLAVIVVLGIIAAIAIPSISGTIAKSKERADGATATVIQQAALRYFYDQHPTGPVGTQDVSVATLKTAGYLDANFSNVKQSDGTSFGDVTGTYNATQGWSVSAPAATS